MSDEEDTAILLGNQRTTEKEIKITPKDTYQDAQSNTISQIQITLASFALLTSGICFGYDLGIVGNAFSNSLNLNCAEQFYTISIWLLGAILSSIFGGFLIDMCGRRVSIITAAWLIIVSSFIASFTKSYAFLLCGRLISGFGGPLLTISQCIYASETFCPKFRGFRISLHHLGCSFGSLLTCIASIYIGSDQNSWRLALVFSSVPAMLTLLITVYWLPVSPHFKLYQRTHNVHKRTTTCRITILVETFIVAILLIIFQQFSGRYTVLYYAPRLFSFLGICASQAAFVAIITFSVVKFLSTFLCVCIVDKLGRRTSLIMSSTIMMTSVAFLALLASLDDTEHSFSYLHYEKCHRVALPDSISLITVPHSEIWHESSNTPVALPKSPPPFPMLPTPLSLVSPTDGCADDGDSGMAPALRVIAVITLLLYEAAYALGLGTVTWVLLAEIFPASVRGRGMCAVTCLRWLADFIIPTVFIKIGPSLSSTFLIYGFICLISILFTFFMVVETKAKTLHQIAQELRNISLVTRIFQNLHNLPLLSRVQWIEQRANQFRQTNRPAVESTII